MTKDEIAINERIEQLRETTGMIATDFARHLGVIPNTYLVTVVYNRRKPPIELMQAILRKYKISARWLILGEGSMWDYHLIKTETNPAELIETAKGIINQLSRMEK